MTSSDDSSRLDRIEKIVESNARAIEANSNANADMRQAIISLSQSVEALVRVATSTIERVERLEGRE